MADATAEPLATVQEAHIYGQITCPVLHTGGVPPSEEQLREVIRFIEGRTMSRVVPLVEDIVHDRGIRVVYERGRRTAESSHARGLGEVRLPRTTLEVPVDCEMMALIPDDAVGEVEEVIRRELEVPLGDHFSLSPLSEHKDHRTSRDVPFVRAVQDALRGFIGD